MSTANGVQLGVAIPQVFLDGPVDMALVGSWLRRAEDLGFDSLWVQEGITGNFPSLEPVSLLSYAAALTSKVRLGTSVMLAPLRNPVQLAKSLGSLDQMSRGRLTVGLGLGTRMSDFATFGISPEKRVRRFVEVLEVMKSLWAEPEAHYQGSFWQLDGVSMEPKPVRRPQPAHLVWRRTPQGFEEGGATRRRLDGGRLQLHGPVQRGGHSPSDFHGGSRPRPINLPHFQAGIYSS